MLQLSDQMRRRTLLALTGAAAVAGVGGCSGLTGSDGEPDEGASGNDRSADDESDADEPADEGTKDESDGDGPDESGPASVAEEFVRTRFEGEESRDELVHEAVAAIGPFELRSVETTVTERGLDPETYKNALDPHPETVTSVLSTSESVIVETTASVVDDSEEQQKTDRWVVVQQNEKWRLFDWVPDWERGPNTNFDFDYDSTSNTVTVILTDGDSIGADELYIRGDSIADGSAGAFHEITPTIGRGGDSWSADEVVHAGQGVEVDVEGGDYLIEVVWNPGPVSETLDSGEGPDR